MQSGAGQSRILGFPNELRRGIATDYPQRPIELCRSLRYKMGVLAGGPVPMPGKRAGTRQETTGLPP